MALELKEQKESPLLSRKEVTAVLSFPQKATPSNADVQKQLADAVKADQKTVVVKQILTRYGEQTADVRAYVYDSEDALKKIEPKSKKEEKKPAADDTEEAPAQAKAEEKPAKEKAPAEEKKEEAKAEEKKEAPAEKPAKDKPAEEKAE